MRRVARDLAPLIVALTGLLAVLEGGGFLEGLKPPSRLAPPGIGWQPGSGPLPTPEPVRHFVLVGGRLIEVWPSPIP